MVICGKMRDIAPSQTWQHRLTVRGSLMVVTPVSGTGDDGSSPSPAASKKWKEVER